MRIVIVGAGAVGFQIAKHLIAENKDVVLIEKRADRSKYVSAHLDCIVINDSGTSIEILKQAGIEKTDFFISVTDSDEVNMIACGIVSSEFNVTSKIARIRNLEYINTQILSKKFLGIDYIVNPEVEAAKVIAKTVDYGAVSDIISFEKTGIQLRSTLINEKSILCSKSLKQIRNSVHKDLLIAGVLRNEQVIIPYGDTVIQPDDKVYIAANEDKLEQIFDNAGLSGKDLNRIVIVGGGQISVYLLKLLMKKYKKITIIDNNYEACKNLSEQFHDVLVINADITDESIYEEEQLKTYDLIITMTGDEELNILTSVFAKKLGISRAISLVINNNYLSMSSHLGIDSAISPKSSTVDSILKYIRRGNIRSVHSLYDGRAEILEFKVDSGSEVSNKYLKDLNMPNDSLIIGISRDGKPYIPDGNFIIKPMDNILIIAVKEAINKIEDMFESKK